jgi:iron complex outermembrane recepter protein
MIRLSILFVLLASSFCSWSQELIRLSGKITSVDSQPIPGAIIHLLNTNHSVSSDSEGHFEIKNIAKGKYTAQISAIGYATAQQVIDVTRASDLTIQLTEATTQLDAVVVTAQKIEEELQRVPFSISALSSRQVLQYRLWNAKDLTAIVPNLYSANLLYVALPQRPTILQ